MKTEEQLTIIAGQWADENIKLLNIYSNYGVLRASFEAGYRQAQADADLERHREMNCNLHGEVKRCLSCALKASAG